MPISVFCFSVIDFDSRFFKNTAAVAGVFTVVGLIGLVLVIALGTNAIRRRRAKRFDADVAAAAAEAAATSNYPFDDDDTRGGGYGYNQPIRIQKVTALFRKVRCHMARVTT